MDKKHYIEVSYESDDKELFEKFLKHILTFLDENNVDVGKSKNFFHFSDIERNEIKVTTNIENKE